MPTRRFFKETRKLKFQGEGTWKEIAKCSRRRWNPTDRVSIQAKEKYGWYNNQRWWQLSVGTARQQWCYRCNVRRLYSPQEISKNNNWQRIVLKRRVNMLDDVVVVGIMVPPREIWFVFTYNKKHPDVGWQAFSLYRRPEGKAAGFQRSSKAPVQLGGGLSSCTWAGSIMQTMIRCIS